MLFNNIKEYTPKIIKTIPFERTVPQHFARKANKTWAISQSRSTNFVCKLILKHLYGTVPGQVLLYGGTTYALTSLVWLPMKGMYQRNNRHRQLDVAIRKEKEYQAKLDEMEDEDDDDEEEEDDE